MALISCPECGKEKVSDTAPTCPECGYAIREHFEKIEQEKLAQEQQIQQQRQAEEKRKNDEENKIQSEKRRMATVTMPNKPTRQKSPYVVAGICALGALLMLFDQEIWGLGLICFFPVILCIYIGNRDYNAAMEKYELAKSDFEKYQKEELRLRDRAAEKARMEQENAPKCPSCQSTNVKPISTASRAVSVGMVGLASSKIGKTMECKSVDINGD